MKRLYLILLTTLLSWQLLAQVVSIGTGTTNVANPINPFYEFSYSQNIYLASEIGQASGGSIYDITFKCANPTMAIGSSNNWTVYMANTSKASFSNKTDWVPVSELTQVFSGIISVSSGKIKITLDTPFDYNGTDNLVIAVDENEFGYNSQDKFYNSNTPESGNRSLFYYADGTNLDPNNPLEAINIEPTIANIDLNFTEVTCFPPTALTSSNVEVETVDIAWTAPADAPAGGYEYYYATNSTEPSSNETSVETTNSTSASLSGLEAHTQYYYWVRSVCSDTDKSAWSNLGTFTTACSSNTATYEHNFDNEDELSNSCWTAIFDNCDGSSVEFTTEGGGKVARLKQSSNKSGAIYFISPRLSDLDGNKTISAKVRSQYSPENWVFEVGTMTDATDVSTFQSLQDISGNITQSWFDVNTNTSAYAGAAGYVVFKYTLPTNNGYNNIFIDEFSYETTATVACQVPLEVTASDITMTSANISWTAPAEAPANGYEYVHSETNTAPTEAGTATNETNFALSGLTANTQYYVWVRSICSDTESSEWTPAFEFTTEAEPVCEVPTAVTVSDITTTTANVAWTAPNNAPANGYEYVYSINNETPTTAGTNTTTANITLENLTANTLYYVWVRSVCGATDYSDWTQAVEFTTSQEPSSSSVASFSFNNQGNLEGWTVVHKEGGSNNTGWSTVSVGGNPTVYPYMGTGLAQFNSYNISAGNSYEFNSPAINFSGLNYQVRFQMYRDNNYPSKLDRVEVFYNTISGTEGGTSLGVINRHKDAEPAAPQVGWHEYTFYIPGTPNGEGYISFLGTSEYGYDIFIDEVVIEEVPSCGKPSEIAYSNITSNSFDVSWTAPTLSSTSFEYYYSTENTMPEADAVVSGTTNEMSVTIDGLEPISYYYVWVRSVCSDTEKSEWASGGSVKTGCGTITAEFTETFDDIEAYGELPNCWAKIAENTSSSYGSITTTYASATPSDYYVRISHNDDNSGSYYLVSPEFSDLDNNKQVTFKVEKDLYSSGSNDDNSGTLELGIMTDANNTETYTTIQNIPLSTLPEEEWKEIVLNTVPYTGATGGHIAIRYTAGSSTYNSFAINDFNYQELPSCLKPLDVSFGNITTVSITASWVAPANTPDSYEYYYSTENIAPTGETEALGTSQETTATISDLEPSTQYFVWVRSVCGSDDKSEWSSVADAKTLCASYTTEFTENFDANVFGQMADCWYKQMVDVGSYPDIQIDHAESVSAPNSMRMYNSSNVTGSFYLISPSFSDLNNNKEVSFHIKREVLYDGSTDKLYNMEVGVMTDAGDVATYQTLQNITQLIEVGVWTEITINTLAYTGGQGHIVIKWNPQAGGDYNKFFIDEFKYAEAEDVSCGTPSNVMATNLSDTEATISWAAPLEAPANGYEYFYSETNTEPTTDGTITSETSVTLSDLNAETQYFVWVRSVCSDTEKSDWSLVVAFTTPADIICEMPTDITVSDITATTANVTWTAPENAPADGYEYFYSETNTEPTTDGTVTSETNVSLSGLSAETQYYVWVRSVCSGTEKSEWSSVATFTTTALPCEMPTDVTVTDVTGTTANVSWTAPTNAPSDGYEIKLYHSVTHELTFVTTTNTSEELTGLDEETTYYVYVRSICNTSSSAWTTSVNFSTESTSVNEIEEAQANTRIYPNPFTSVVTVTNITKVTRIEVTDVVGKLVKVFEPQKELNMSNLPSGLYMVNMTYTDGSVKSLKVAKK